MIQSENFDYENIDDLNEFDDVIDDNFDEDKFDDNFDEDKLDIDDDIDTDDDIDDKDIVINTINHDESESELDIYFKYGTNNHKLDGKHRLKRDTILNGKLVDNNLNIENGASFYEPMDFDFYSSSNIPLERGSIFEEESKNSDDILNKRKLSKDVYSLLKNNTDLDFSSNRRKPNKTAFNNYYKMLLLNIDSHYTKSEIFVELAYYFTDNIFNMYKLLDKKHATAIIIELRDKGFLNKLNHINFM